MHQAVNMQFAFLTSVMNTVGLEAKLNIANHLRAVTNGKHFLLVKYHQDETITVDDKSGMYSLAFKAIAGAHNGNKPDWSLLQGQQANGNNSERSKFETGTTNVISEAAATNETREGTTLKTFGLKRYVENVLDGFDGKEQEVVDCAIHLGWLGPHYLNVAADIEYIRAELPKLTKRFEQEGRSSEQALVDAYEQTGLFAEIMARWVK